MDAGETRVAVLEGKGSARQGKGQNKNNGSAGFKVAELYVERKGSRSIVGNIYKGVVDNVLPGMEAAFVDIGLERNGFLHVDEIVLEDGQKAPRRGHGRGRRIDELIKPKQEVLVQVVKDPLKTKGARLSMQLSIAGRYLVYMPLGAGVGASRRLPDAERDRQRKLLQNLHKGDGGRDRPHRRPGGAQGGLRARPRLPAQAVRGDAAPGQGGEGAGDGLPGGRPLDPGAARRAHQGVRRRGDRRSQAAPPGDQLLPAHGAGAGRFRRALQGSEAAARARGRRGGVHRGALAAGRPALGRLSDDRLRRGADGDRRQHRQLHRPRQGAAGGHDHEGQRRGGRGGRPPAAAARHRRDHRHRLHRHGAGEEPRPGAEDAEEGARRRQDEELRDGGLAARPGRDDPPERHRRGARDPHRDLPHLRGRGRRAVGGDDGDRGAAQAARAGRRQPKPEAS